MAAVLMTNWLFAYCKPFKWEFFLYICALVDKISTNKARCGLSAVAEQLVYLLFWHIFSIFLKF